jgi:hypothetical protein
MLLAIAILALPAPPAEQVERGERCGERRDGSLRFHDCKPPWMAGILLGFFLHRDCGSAILQPPKRADAATIFWTKGKKGVHFGQRKVSLARRFISVHRLVNGETSGRRRLAFPNMGIA